MGTKRWDFRDEDLRQYSVEVAHSTVSGQRLIAVNGREVYRGGTFFDTAREHVFDVDGHGACLRIGTDGFGYTYQLTVDGLAIPPDGAVIPRLARPAPVDASAGGAAAASAPELAEARVPAATTFAFAPADRGVDRVALVRRVENGGRWFYWIAGLSAINFALYVLGSGLGFALGTAMDWFVDGLVQGWAPAFTWVAHAGTIGLFAFLGLRATNGAAWAFAVGSVIYALDAVILLFVGDWIGIAIHAVALVAIVNGMLAIRRLGQASLLPTPAA